MSEADANQDWIQHKMLIINNIERLEQEQKDIGNEIQVMSHDIQALQYEAAMWGGFAGLIPAIIFIVLAYLKFHKLLKEG